MLWRFANLFDVSSDVEQMLTFPAADELLPSSASSSSSSMLVIVVFEVDLSSANERCPLVEGKSSTSIADNMAIVDDLGR